MDRTLNFPYLPYDMDVTDTSHINNIRSYNNIKANNNNSRQHTTESARIYCTQKTKALTRLNLNHLDHSEARIKLYSSTGIGQK